MKHAALAFWASPILWLAVLSTPSWSQGLTYEDGYIHYVEGSVHLQRALEPEPEPGEINVPVLPGDRVWTEAGSRAEILFSDGAILRLDERTKIDVIDLGTEQLFHVWSGSVIVVKPTAAVSRLDSPAGSVQTQTEGTYRIDVHGGETITLSVYVGVAELGSDRGSVVVRRGQRSIVGLGQAPDSLWAFRATDYDDFDRWSAGRSPRATSSRSTVIRSLPPEVRPYSSELTAYGEWRGHSEFGSVWYPTVGVGWAPYRDGRWCYTPYGYTWVSYERWGWAPYHYGRWGYGSGGWFWIPGRHWGPAWVSFAVGPAWVGWSPLGYHGRPVYGFHSVVGRHGYGTKRVGRPYRGGKAVPRELYAHGAGWNFVDRKHFARGRARSARLRLADVERGSAQVRLLEEGALLNRDLTSRATGIETARHEAGARGRAIRRSTASVGRQARTALRTTAIQRDTQALRGLASPSRAQPSTPAQRMRQPLRSTSRSRGRSSVLGRPVERSSPRLGRRDSDPGPSRPTVGDRARAAPDSSRATGRSIRRRGPREFAEGAERVRPPTRSRAQRTRDQSSTERGGASMAPTRAPQSRGLRTGPRTSSRAPETRGRGATVRGRSANGRGLGANPGRGGASRARKR